MVILFSKLIPSLPLHVSQLSGRKAELFYCKSHKPSACLKGFLNYCLSLPYSERRDFIPHLENYKKKSNKNQKQVEFFFKHNLTFFRIRLLHNVLSLPELTVCFVVVIYHLMPLLANQESFPVKYCKALRN